MAYLSEPNMKDAHMLQVLLSAIEDSLRRLRGSFSASKTSSRVVHLRMVEVKRLIFRYRMTRCKTDSPVLFQNLLLLAIVELPF